MNYKFMIFIALFILNSSTYADKLSFGRCHMDECSWAKILSQKEIAADMRGRLIELKLRGGSSPNDDSDLNNPKITWNKYTHKVYIFCSVYLPVSMMKSEGKYQVDILDFWQGTPGILESSASLYREACHPSSMGLNEQTLAKRFGYRKLEDTHSLDIVVHKPIDIFNYVK